MNFKKFENNDEKKFVISSCLLSFFVSLLYLWKGISDGFILVTVVVICFAVLYIPVVCFFRKPGFLVYSIVYSLILVYLIAFHQSYLYNNFTGLLAVFVVMMVHPKYKWWALGIYGFAACIAFAFNEENLCHFLIHITRGAWFFDIFNYVLLEKYQRKKLILYDDEIKILKELSKNRLQKSISLDGYSESTIYRRIKAACKRNNLSKSELLSQFQKESLSED